MDRFDRIYQLHHLLAGARAPVSRQRIQQALECSRSTAKRIVEAMRLYFDAPIVYDRQRGGYRYDTAAKQDFELPGLWFSASELQSLLLMQQLLRQVQPGLLDDQLTPIRSRIDKLLQQRHIDGSSLDQRIRLLSNAPRPPGTGFNAVAEAVVGGRRLHIRYHARGNDRTSERQVSPQRLTRYRDNWYLEAWCHTRDALRLFALDRIEILGHPPAKAKRLPTKQLDAAYDNYGIFPGSADATAILAFSAERARWIANEQWHPQQHSRWRDDGRYELHIPYADPTELILDILRYGPDVEVLAPDSLRQTVHQRLQQAADAYQGN